MRHFSRVIQALIVGCFIACVSGCSLHQARVNSLRVAADCACQKQLGVRWRLTDSNWVAGPISATTIHGGTVANTYAIDNLDQTRFEECMEAKGFHCLFRRPNFDRPDWSHVWDTNVDPAWPECVGKPLGPYWNENLPEWKICQDLNSWPSDSVGDLYEYPISDSCKQGSDVAAPPALTPSQQDERCLKYCAAVRAKHGPKAAACSCGSEATRSASVNLDQVDLDLNEVGIVKVTTSGPFAGVACFAACIRANGVENETLCSSECGIDAASAGKPSAQR